MQVLYSILYSDLHKFKADHRDFVWCSRNFGVNISISLRGGRELNSISHYSNRLLGYSKINRRHFAILARETGVNFNSCYRLENCIIFHVTARLITHSVTRRDISFFCFYRSPGGRSESEPKESPRWKKADAKWAVKRSPEIPSAYYTWPRECARARASEPVNYSLRRELCKLLTPGLTSST